VALLVRAVLHMETTSTVYGESPSLQARYDIPMTFLSQCFSDITAINKLCQRWFILCRTRVGSCNLYNCSHL